MDRLQRERDLAVTENASLATEMAKLRTELLESYRTGLTRTGRFILGRAVAGLLLVALATFALRSRWPLFNEPDPSTTVTAGTSATPIQPIGPDRLVLPVINKFGVAPKSIELVYGRNLTITFAGGAYAGLTREAQRVQATAVARFVLAGERRRRLSNSPCASFNQRNSLRFIAML